MVHPTHMYQKKNLAIHQLYHRGPLLVHQVWRIEGLLRKEPLYHNWWAWNLDIGIWTLKVGHRIWSCFQRAQKKSWYWFVCGSMSGLDTLRKNIPKPSWLQFSLPLVDTRASTAKVVGLMWSLFLMNTYRYSIGIW